MSSTATRETQAATARPWHIVDRRDAPLRNIKIAGADKTFVAEIDGVPTRDRMLYKRLDHPSGWTDEQADILDFLALANAQYIVEAVNAHDSLRSQVRELQEAAQKALTAFRYRRDKDTQAWDAWDSLRAALRLGEGAGER